MGVCDYGRVTLCVASMSDVAASHSHASARFLCHDISTRSRTCIAPMKQQLGNGSCTQPTTSRSSAYAVISTHFLFSFCDLHAKIIGVFYTRNYPLFQLSVVSQLLNHQSWCTIQVIANTKQCNNLLNNKKCLIAVATAVRVNERDNTGQVLLL